LLAIYSSTRYYPSILPSDKAMAVAEQFQSQLQSVIGLIGTPGSKQ
jgi:hypothetical protein